MFESKGNILAKILTEKWVGHGPPVPPCSYTYEHNGDIRHKQMYIQSLSIWRGLAHLFSTGRSLSSRPWRLWPRSPLHLAVQFTPRPAECPRMRRSRFSGDKRHYLTAPQLLAVGVFTPYRDFFPCFANIAMFEDFQGCR